jgi:hypothetical protein
MLFYLFVLKGIIVEEIFDFVMAIEPKVFVFSLTKYLKTPLSIIDKHRLRIVTHLSERIELFLLFLFLLIFPFIEFDFNVVLL